MAGFEHGEPFMRKSTIKALWEEFGNVGIDDNDCIDSTFCGWEFGTNRFDIWRWFDEQYAAYGGVHALMYPEEHMKSKFGKVMAYVHFQVWLPSDYTFTFDEAEFDCAPVLDEWELDNVKCLEAGRCGYDTDNIYHRATALDLVKTHDGPFDCYIVDEDELAAYIKAREEA